MQIDLFEVHEAFAVEPLVFAETSGVSLTKVNLNGGALSLGWPAGAIDIAWGEGESSDRSSSFFDLNPRRKSCFCLCEPGMSALRSVLALMRALESRGLRFGCVVANSAAEGSSTALVVESL